MKFTIPAKLVDDKLTITDGKTYQYALKELAYVSKPETLLDVTLARCSKARTSRQNNFYWFYLHVIAKDTGNDEKTLHELFKAHFLPLREVTINGNKHLVTGSTTDLTNEQFTIYLDNIAEFTGIPAPETNSYYYSYASFGEDAAN